MRKFFALFLAVLVFTAAPFAPVISESPAFVIGEEDSVEVGKMGDAIAIEDLFEFKAEKWEFINSIPDYYSGDQHQFFRIDFRLRIDSVEPHPFNKYITDAKLTFRDKFEYDVPLQIGDVERPIEPLTYGFISYFYKVPNVIETSKDPLVLYLTVNGVEYAFKIR